MSDPKTAAYQMPLINRRRVRADSLAATILQVIEPFVKDDEMHSVADALRSLLRTEGVEIMSDNERALVGLPPRDELGWTPDELRAVEARRLDIMTRPLFVSTDALLRRGAEEVPGGKVGEWSAPFVSRSHIGKDEA